MANTSTSGRSALKLVRRPAVEKITGLSRSTIYELMKPV
ncbi:MAG: AlpA family phage regulatory protein [Rhodobacteraceae bacterium]|nr:AlpA family phage regulatory protein [Paracoccaceae bacterium]